MAGLQLKRLEKLFVLHDEWLRVQEEEEEVGTSTPREKTYTSLRSRVWQLLTNRVRARRTARHV